MSIPPDQMPPPDAPQQGNILTRKFAGLPGWAWAGVALVGGYLLYRHFTSSSASTSSSTGMATSTTGTSVGAGYTDLQPIILDQSPPGSSINPGVPMIPGTTPTKTTTPSTSTFSGEKQIGSGYGYANVAGFQYIPNPTELNALESAGYKIFYQPAPGIFVPTAGHKQLKNTPQYFNPSAKNK